MLQGQFPLRQRSPRWQILGNGLAIVLALAVFALASWANLDLVEGRFALFMDERIIFDGVNAILTPKDFGHLIWTISDGDEHRYGRALFYLAALVAAVPKLVWGEPGLILAVREFQTLTLIGSFLVLSFGLLRNGFLRFGLLLSLVTLPFASYYMTMPKPEPLQILAVATFLVLALRRDHRFGWHWLFLGFAFGVKISTLLCLPPLIVIAAWASARQSGHKAAMEDGFIAIVWFVLGWTIAVPMFLRFAILFSLGAALVMWSWPKPRPIRLLIAGAFVAWAALDFWICQGEFSKWLAFTFFNTGHGSDQVTIHLTDWLIYLFKDWFSAPLVASVPLVGSVSIFLLADAVQRAGKQGLLKSLFSGSGGWATLLAGLAWISAIMLTVKRLWGIYLLPGFSLVLAGLYMTIEHQWQNRSQNGSSPLQTSLKVLSLVVALAVDGTAIAFWAPSTVHSFYELATRTQSVVFQQQRETYAAITQFLTQLPSKNDRPLLVYFDPKFFPPQNTPQLTIKEFFGPFNAWAEGADVIIFGKEHGVSAAPLPRDSIEYPQYLDERKGYQAHVATSQQSCNEKPCYHRKLVLPDGTEILVLQ